ncbi:MAG TPA: aldolase/citrate lyase family protein [Devosia sp.]|nr:aldolase/citrate lyase family protein [Devosia sp.]
MSTPNALKAALRRGETQLGLWLMLNSPLATEMAAGAGFDWLLIDMEHSVTSEAEAVGHLRSARVDGAPEALVRIPWNEPVVIKRLLDSGARSLLVPMVQNAEEARRAVAATRYPPAGIRGFSGMHRGNDFGRIKDYPHSAAEDIFLAVQVESPEAVANAGEIAAVEGVDCVFVGPNDLAANMGMIGQVYSAEVQAMIGRVIEPVRAAGKAPGLLDFNLETAPGWLERGFTMLAVASDLSLLAGGMDRLLKAYR